MILTFGHAQAQDPRSSGWYPAAGVTWVRPMDSGLRELYSGGPGLSGGMGYNWPRKFRLEVRLDWFRQGGNPERPRFATSASSRLTLTPVALQGHWSLLRGSTRPYLAFGTAVLFSEERFEYQLLGATNSTVGRRSDFAGLLGAGLEFERERLTFRIAARGILGSGDRQVLRATGRTDATNQKAHGSIWTLGLDLTLP